VVGARVNTAMKTAVLARPSGKACWPRRGFDDDSVRTRAPWGKSVKAIENLAAIRAQMA
jgi:hypothetical protein